MEALQASQVNYGYLGFLKNIYERAAMIINVNLDEGIDEIHIRKQKETLLFKLFSVAVEHIRININRCGLSHFRYVNDIVIFAKHLEELTQIVVNFNEASNKVGFANKHGENQSYDSNGKD